MFYDQIKEFKMIRRLVFIAGAAAAMLLPQAPSFAQAPGWAKLRIAVEGNYPPFSQLGTDGKLSGFEIDFANALCAEIKAECTLVQQEFDGLMPALNAKKFDAIVASLTITDARKQVADFSDPYYDVPSRWVAKAGTFKEATPAALKGKKIIVLRNSPRAKFLQENYKDSEILLVAKETEVYQELVAGRGDIGFGSSVVSSEAFLKKPEGKGFAQVGATVRLPGSPGVGIATRKGEAELVSKLNAGIKALRSNGTFQKMADKYFDFDISGY